MKSAKEITEYLEREYQSNEDANIHLVYVQHEDGYYTKIDTLKMLREYLLKWEYYSNTDYDMKGIENALKWVLGK